MHFIILSFLKINNIIYLFLIYHIFLYFNILITIIVLKIISILFNNLSSFVNKLLRKHLTYQTPIKAKKPSIRVSITICMSCLIHKNFFLSIKLFFLNDFFLNTIKISVQFTMIYLVAFS